MLLWPVPLLGLLHVESSAVVATTAYFVAGLSSISLFRRGHALGEVLAWQIGALIIPLALLTFSILWRPNCAYALGLLFYGLFAIPTTVFAVGFARFLYLMDVQWQNGWMVLFGAAVCLLGPIYDVGFHPQFYTYNHVFGGILGPVYDEELALRPGLFIFRALTLVWAAFFVLLGQVANVWKRTAGTPTHVGRWTSSALLVTILILFLTYAFSAELGFTTTMERLRAALPGHRETEHFDIHYDPDSVSEIELKVLADEHEFRYRELARILGVDVRERIQSFIYPDSEAKAALTGARYTNVAPVWLAVPQSHVLKSEFTSVFPHELAHVFSREFGLPLVNASLAVGLVEGLAVALEPASGLPTPHEQVSAALLARMDLHGDPEEAAAAGARDLAGVVAVHLSPMGFWTGRGAVSYTTMGSFVRYLLDAYGADRLKQVYALGNFSAVYGKPVGRLAAEWTESLLALPATSASAGPLVTARFAVPSLLEKRCPHYVPPYRLAYRRASTSLVRGDSAEALAAAEMSLQREPRYVPSLNLWARLMLVRGEQERVRARIETIPSDSMSAAMFVRLGDSRALTGDSTGARLAYDRALEQLPSFSHEDASRIYLRHAAAGRPGIIRTLLDGRPAPAGDDPLAAMARSFHLAHFERYEQAVELLRTTPLEGRIFVSRTATETLRRRRLVWLARFSYRAGALSAASAYAGRAAGAYRNAGAFNEAAMLDDFQNKMSWLASSSTALRQPDVLSQADSK